MIRVRDTYEVVHKCACRWRQVTLLIYMAPYDGLHSYIRDKVLGIEITLLLVLIAI